MPEFLIVEKEGNIGTITINRPERRNALTPTLLGELKDTMNAFAQQDVRAVVITGAGDKAFSGGYDIGEIKVDRQAAEDPERRQQASEGRNPLQEGLQSVMDFPYPVIAMINGYAVGAGCELTVACDIRIASEKARLGMTPAKLGILYSADGLQRFINLVGLASTKEMFFTGRLFDANRALEMGLVNQVVPPEELSKTVYDLAEEIAANAPMAVSSTKKTLAMVLDYQQISPEHQKEILEMTVRCFTSEDLQEGRRAFFEKRKPNFKGK